MGQEHTCLPRISQDCSQLKGHFRDEVFFDCTFDNLNGLVLDHCDLNKSKFVTDNVRDALGLTLTLTCNSFSNVEYSPLLFDLFLVMALKSSGNTEKRRKLIDVIGRERVVELLTAIKDLE
jgi:hypothetical protein